MKKYILGLLTLVCMGLLAFSCSDDENNNGGMDAGQVRISAILPGDFIMTDTRVALPYKLRCILEVRSKDATTKLACREEVVIESATGAESLSFDFALPAGSYDCLMWADYIDTDGVDKYYNTSDLKNITVKDGTNLINNKACDAFFYNGEIHKEEDKALQQEVRLVRPFAKVSVLEKNLKEFNLLKGLAVSYEASMAFDVSTGKVLEGTTSIVNYTNTDFNPEVVADGTLFSAYFFTNEESQKLGEINLNFTTDLGVQNVVVPQIVPLLRNQHIKVSGNMMNESPDPDNEFEISFEVEVEDWGTSNQDIVAAEVKPKVGDFFYADGSYSSVYLKDETNPCIGIVFAVAHDGGKAADDKPENYIDNTGKQKIQKVRGWVVAAKGTENRFKVKVDNPDNPAQEVTLNLGTLPGSALGRGKTDILGFKNTQVFRQSEIKLTEYPLVEQIIKYEDVLETKALEGTSGWYWGAVKQYLILAEEYATVTVENKVVVGWEYLTVGRSMEFLSNDQIGAHFGLDGEQFYWSSTVDASSGKVFRVGLRTEGANYGQTAGWKLNDARHFRPILTF